MKWFHHEMILRIMKCIIDAFHVCKTFHDHRSFHESARIHFIRQILTVYLSATSSSISTPRPGISGIFT